MDVNQEFPQHAGVLLGVIGAIPILLSRLDVAEAGGTLGQPFVKAAAFFESAQGGPQGGLDGLLLFDGEVTRGEGVSDATAEPEEAVLFQFPKDTSAIGAGER